MPKHPSSPEQAQSPEQQPVEFSLGSALGATATTGAKPILEIASREELPDGTVIWSGRGKLRPIKLGNGSKNKAYAEEMQLPGE